MRIIHLTGPIGSGKTTIDMCLRNETGAIGIKGETARVSDLLYIGRIHRRRKLKYSDKFIKFGGLDDYLRKNNHDVNDLVNEINSNQNSGAKYCVIAGIRDFKKHITKFSNHEFYEIISLRGAKRVLRQREERRGYQGDAKELANIQKEIDAYDNEIKRWENLKQIYSNVNLTVFDKSMLFTDRMEYILNLMHKPARTSGHYKRDFFQEN